MREGGTGNGKSKSLEDGEGCGEDCRYERIEGWNVGFLVILTVLAAGLANSRSWIFLINRVDEAQIDCSCG